MAKELLQTAIDALKIRDVYIRSSSSSLAENFEPKYHEMGDDEITTQNMHVVEQSSQFELAETENNSSTILFRVQIALGTRWIREQPATDVPANENVLAEIEARLVAEYHLADEVDKAALDEFAMNNASFHVWPYWREYLSSQCNKMNLPKTVVPAVQFAQNRSKS